MRKLIALLILLLCIGAFFLWRWMQQPDVRSIERSAPIIFFGDSLVYGTGAEPGEDMPSLLSQQLGRLIVNAGHPGDTTADGLDRLDRDVLRHQPGLVLLLLGGNDVLQKIDSQETFTNLETIIDRIIETGGQVVLIGVRGGLFLDTYSDDYANLARKKGVVYVSDILYGIFNDPALKADSVHPNADGYRKMAGRLEPILRGYLE